MTEDRNFDSLAEKFQRKVYDRIKGAIRLAVLQRFLNDYVQVLRGGNENPQAVIAMEMRYSTREPYLWLGRYIHFICRRAQVSGQSRYREGQL